MNSYFFTSPESRVDILYWLTRRELIYHLNGGTLFEKRRQLMPHRSYSQRRVHLAVVHKVCLIPVERAF